MTFIYNSLQFRSTPGSDLRDLKSHTLINRSDQMSDKPSAQLFPKAKSRAICTVQLRMHIRRANPLVICDSLQFMTLTMSLLSNDP